MDLAHIKSVQGGESVDAAIRIRETVGGDIMKRALVSSQTVLGARSVLNIRRIGRSFSFKEEILNNHSYGCDPMRGFLIHDATSIRAHKSERLAKLLSYLSRDPVSYGRTSLDENVTILYELKNSYDDATHVMFLQWSSLKNLHRYYHLYIKIKSIR